MRVLETYILRRIAAQATGAVVASLAIVWTTQALSKVNLVTDSGASASAFLLLATLLLPAIVPIVVPFAVLIASAQTLNGMNTDSELPVIHAAGATRGVVFRPFLILAVIASLLVIVFGNLVEPYARQRARVLIAEARANFISLLIQENTFKRVDDNLYMQVAQRLPDGRLGGLFIADSRDPKQDVIYYAREGALVKEGEISLLLMRDGEIQSRTPSSGALSVIHFKSYAFDLTEFTATDKGVVLMPKDRFTHDLLYPDRKDKVYTDHPNQFVLEFNRRISEWLYVPAFVLLALVISGTPRSNRGDSAMQLFFALATAFAIRWAGIIAEGLTDSSGNLWPLIYCPPVLTILACVFVLRRSTIPSQDNPLLIAIERMGTLPQTIAKLVSRFVKKYSGDLSS